MILLGQNHLKLEVGMRKSEKMANGDRLSVRGNRSGFKV